MTKFNSHEVPNEVSREDIKAQIMEFYTHTLLLPTVIVELLNDEIPTTNILGALYELKSEGKIKRDPYEVFLEGSLYRYTVVNIPEEKKGTKIELTEEEFNVIFSGWLNQTDEYFKTMSGRVVRKWLRIWTGN